MEVAELAATKLRPKQRSSMNLHEYQAKEIFARYGIVVPKGQLATSPEGARAAREADRR